MAERLGVWLVGGGVAQRCDQGGPVRRQGGGFVRAAGAEHGELGGARPAVGAVQELQRLRAGPVEQSDGALEPRAVLHAQRIVEDDDARGRRRPGVLGGEQRPRRARQQGRGTRQQSRPQQHQEQVADPAGPLPGEQDPTHQDHGREPQPPRPGPHNQVDQHGDRGGGAAPEQGGMGKGKGVSHNRAPGIPQKRDFRLYSGRTQS